VYRTAIDNENRRHVGHRAIEIIGSVEVKPKQSGELVVGIYERGMPEPVLELKYEPNLGDVIGASLDRVEDEQGDYTLVYHLENFGDQPCKVTVVGDVGSQL
jgi:hypothetical protein